MLLSNQQQEYIVTPLYTSMICISGWARVFYSTELALPKMIPRLVLNYLTKNVLAEVRSLQNICFTFFLSKLSDKIIAYFLYSLLSG
jgi:hypothetical protein